MGIADMKAAFSEAWPDLRVRLERGLDTLRGLCDAADPADAQRLAAKQHGLEDALALYERVQDTAAGDFAGAWRRLTDALSGAYQADGLSDAHRAGLALALEYQRGYAPEIDAPPLHQLVGTR